MDLIKWDTFRHAGDMGGAYSVDHHTELGNKVWTSLIQWLGRKPKYKGAARKRGTVYFKYGPFSTEAEAAEFHKDVMIAKDRLLDEYGVVGTTDVVSGKKAEGTLTEEETNVRRNYWAALSNWTWRQARGEDPGVKPTYEYPVVYYVRLTLVARGGAV